MQPELLSKFCTFGHILCHYKVVHEKNCKIFLKQIKNSYSYEVYSYDHRAVIWVKVFKNGPSKICGRLPLKKSLQIF